MAEKIALWRPKVGAGQSKAFTSGAAASFTNAIGANTFAVAISVITANCLVSITATGAAATATSDFLIKSSDPPVIFACAPGDHVSVWGLGAGTAYLAEMTH